MTTTATRIRAFINAAAGQDDKAGAPERLQPLFAAAGWDSDVVEVGRGADIRALAAAAVSEGYDVVAAGGGDGTLNAVASALAGTETAFGVLPVGTLNHFARDLGLPLDLTEAARAMVNGAVRRVDVGEANGRVFLNNAIIGLYPVYRFIKDRHETRGTHGKLAFAAAVFEIFRRYPYLTVRLNLNGAEVIRRTPYILIANNRHAMQGYDLGSRETLEEGLLYLYILKPRSRWGLFRSILRLVAGRLSGPEEFEILATPECWVETRGKRLGVALDGEVAVLEEPLRFRSLPRALKVIAPRPA